MQERKDSANGSGANPSLDADAAEELAANFRPAWEVDDEPEKTDIAPPPAVVPAPDANTEVRIAPPAANALSKATVIGLAPAPSPAQEAKKVDLGKTMPLEAGTPSPRVIVATPSKAVELESSALVEATPSNPIAPQAPKTAPLLESPPRTGPAPGRARSSSRPVAVAADPFAPAPPRTSARPRPMPDGTEELAALVAKRPAKNYLYVAVGCGVALALGVFLKFALSDDGSKPPATTSTQSTAQAPLTPTNEIPPPPPKEEVVPPPATQATVAKADPPAPPPPPPPPAAAPRAPEPPPRTAAAVPPPRVAPPPPRPPPAAAPPTRPASKPGTGGGSGGIVRDNPF